MALYRVSVEKNKEPKSTRDASNNQEKQIAKRVGGKKTANSGATAFHKGDVTINTDSGNNDWLIEAKTCMTDKESFSIKKAWIEKNKQEAVFMDKDYHCLAFNFGPNQPNYYIIDELTFQELLTLQNSVGENHDKLE